MINYLLPNFFLMTMHHQ